MDEQATGQPRRSGRPAARQRLVLVGDLDGEVLAPLRAAEEVLLCLALWEDDDRDDPADDGADLRLSAPLADRVALATVQRLADRPGTHPVPATVTRSAAGSRRPLRTRPAD